MNPTEPKKQQRDPDSNFRVVPGEGRAFEGETQKVPKGYFSRVWEPDKKSDRFIFSTTLPGSFSKHIRSRIWMTVDFIGGSISMLLGYALSPSFSLSVTQLPVAFIIFSRIDRTS